MTYTAINTVVTYPDTNTLVTYAEKERIKEFREGPSLPRSRGRMPSSATSLHY